MNTKASNINPQENNSTEDVSDESKVHPVIRLMVECFDQEYLRCKLRESFMKMEVSPMNGFMTWFYSQAANQNFFTFFNSANLERLAQEVLENETIRNFVMNVTERVSLHLNFMEPSLVTSFEGNMMRALIRNKPNPETGSSLINKEVISAIYVDGETVKTYIADSFWLIVLYVILMNCHSSYVYQEQLKSIVG